MRLLFDYVIIQNYVYTYVFEGDRLTSVRVRVIFLIINVDISQVFPKIGYITNYPIRDVTLVPYCVSAILLQPERFFVDQACPLRVCA